jgi:hypothetical protein
MEPLQVNLCDQCKEFVFKTSTSNAIQRRTSLKVLLDSSGSCHCCSTLHGLLARTSSEVRTRFDISDKEIDDFPVAISHTSAQNSVGGLCSKVVTATLELPNGFIYPSEMTIAWSPSNCKEVIPIKALGLSTDTSCLSICVQIS